MRPGIYERIFDFFWKPIGLVSKLLLSFRAVQRSRFAPFVLGAVTGRWPERVTQIDQLGDLSELSEEDRALVMKKARER